jgi:hypothetical protein
MAVQVRFQVRWRLILCLWGLTLFGMLTCGSMRVNSIRFNADMGKQHHHIRYFWWGSVRLDSDPLKKRPRIEPCVAELDAECAGEPEYIWIDPGWIERALTIYAFPAFLLAIGVAHGLAHTGKSELLSFMVAMPLFTLAWFYSVGGSLIAGNSSENHVEPRSVSGSV